MMNSVTSRPATVSAATIIKSQTLAVRVPAPVTRLSTPSTTSAHGACGDVTEVRRRDLRMVFAAQNELATRQVVYGLFYNLLAVGEASLLPTWVIRARKIRSARRSMSAVPRNRRSIRVLLFRREVPRGDLSRCSKAGEQSCGYWITDDVIGRRLDVSLGARQGSV
jgi:hypothetical protein